MSPPRTDPLPPPAPEPRLDDRIRGLLGENGGRLAFNGLRRALHAHPESLQRALKRLEREGVVQHGEDGYSLVAPPDVPVAPRLEPATRTVASVQLPTGIPSDAVLGQLAGRWFGALRWVGVYDRPHDPWLVWSVGASHERVMLSVRRGTIRVLVEDGARGEAPREASESAAWDLLRHALDRLHPVPDSSSGTRTFGTSESPRAAPLGFAA
ncbi:MAG: hypothetical protein ACREDK_03640 [Thermoplasmata archaeon]